MTDTRERARLIDWLNAFKADPFSTGADKVDRLLEIIASLATVSPLPVQRHISPWDM